MGLVAQTQHWPGTVSRSNCSITHSPCAAGTQGKHFWNSPLTHTHCRAPVRCWVQHSCACTHITAAHPLSQDSHHCPKEEQSHLQLWRDESLESPDTPSPLILLVLDSQSVQQGPCHPSERKRITTVIRCKPNRSLHGCEIPLIPSLRVPDEMHY